MRIGSYELRELIHQSSLSQVHRARRITDDVEVFVKTAAAHTNAADIVTQLRHELLVCRMFDEPNLIRAIELIEGDRDTALVLESVPEAVTLRERATTAKLSIAEAVSVALAILDALANLHARNIVHKDVKPDNVLVDRELRRIVLIDFGIAAIVPRDVGSAANTKLQGTLAFMPPEQTGRINRAIDYRSDYYALGSTLYWMLSGEPPFGEFGEPEELVHAHIAKRPRLLDARDPAIPPALARIVAKLLSKAAEARYQGAFGLRADLRRVADELAVDGRPDFEIATVDPAEQLRLPHHVYGRAAELQKLRAAIQAIDTSPQIIVLRGPPGTGKTTLARELIASITQDVSVVEARLVAGTDPLVTLGEVLRRLFVEQIEYDENSQAQLELRLRDALGPNGALLLEFIPELERLLGPQSAVKNVAPGQARDRFRDTLDRLVDALLLPSRRYLLFVDDAQLADESAVRALEAVAFGPGRALMLALDHELVLDLEHELDNQPVEREASPHGGRRPSTGGFNGREDNQPVEREASPHGGRRPSTGGFNGRDDNQPREHPISRLLSHARARGITPTIVELGPLTMQDVGELVDEVLDHAPGSRELTQLLHRRTRGTALFVGQLLDGLYVDGVIDIDRTTGRWRIDLDAALRHESSGDIVEYLVRRFAELPERSRQVLGVAASIGPSFDLETLTAVIGERVDEAIWEATAAGYLLSFGDGQVHLGVRATTPGGTASDYRFAHERLRQLALSAVPDPAPMHLAIVRALVDDELGAEQLSRLADHIAGSAELLDDHAERIRFAGICEHAGAVAKTSAAYASAARQFETALRLLDGESPARRLAVALEHGECLYLNGRLDDAEALFTSAAELCSTRADHAQLLMVRGQLVMVHDQTERALEILMEAVALFNLDLRRGGSQEWVGGLVQALLVEFASLTPERLAQLPLLEDPEQLYLCNLLSSATYPAYLANDFNLFTALLVTVIRRTLVHGLTEVSAICFVQFGIVLAGGMNDHAGARRCVELGFATLARFPDSAVAGQVELVYYPTLQPLLEPIGDGITAMAGTHRKLRTSGALTLAGYILGGRTTHELLVGVPLKQTIEGTRDSIAYMTGISIRSQEIQARVFSVVAHALASSDVRTSGELLPEGFDSDEAVFAGLTPITMFLCHTARAYAYALLGDRPRATADLRAAAPLASVATGQLGKLWFEIVRALVDCADYPSMAPAQAEVVARDIYELRASLTRWEQSCPANATPMRCLVDGVWARARGKLDEAVACLTEAADTAATARFHNIEGIACELAAEILLAGGDRRRAVGYLGDALQAYGRWGALPLQRRVRKTLHENGQFALSSTGTTSSPLLGDDSSKALDIASVIKMSQAMLEATDLEEVIGRLLATINENAGADRCLLLLDSDEGLRLRAERRATGELFLFEAGVRLSSASQLLATSVVQLGARSQVPVIIDDASRDPRCARDPHVIREQLRALLVVPILTRIRRVGLLYLENRVTPGAFTAHHVQLASTLAAQAASSIENAQLFEALREGEAQWRAVVSGAPDTILILDRERRIEFVNHTAHGIDPDRLLGKRAEKMVTPESRARLLAAVEFVFETGTMTNIESSVATPAGVRLFTSRVGPIGQDGEIDRVIVIATDVTEQRRLEQELRHSQKMQAIGTLAGGIAHDFNNLLTVIIGASDLCALQAGDNEPVRELLDEIEGAASRAASLTRQLLAFSRKQMLQPKRFDLCELVRELGKMLMRLLGETVVLRLELAAHPCTVHADPSQFSQVLVNLAVNARDAMPGGGTLSIRVEHDESGHVLLDVSDTGLGMEEELLNHIFEPFFTTKGEGKGTGLGLSTVLGIVEQSGGRIEVDSHVGRGTRFRIELPPATPEPGERGVPVATLPRGTETVLLVEDELAVRRLAARMLELQGYRVRVATGGEEALTIARELTHLDLLITDVIMPGLGGPEVADHVVRIHPRAKVLYISGHTTDEVLHRGVRDGTRTLLQKPFTREAIAEQVRAILDRPSALESERL